MVRHAIRRLLGFDERPRVVDAREGYALWARTYPPHAHNPLMRTEQAIVGPLIEGLSPRRALDVGTGSGRNLPVLASTGARLVVGIDLSMAMLQKCQPHGLVCADACRLPVCDGAFDLVSASLMVGDIADMGVWLAEMCRVLSRGGHLIYSDFHPSWAAKGWKRTFQAPDGRALEIPYFPHAIADHLTRLAEAGFEVKTIREPRLTDAIRQSPAPGRPGDDEPVLAVFDAVKHGHQGAVEVSAPC